MSKIRNARCENKVNPINVDTQSPRFSWQIVSDEHDVFQTWYRIVVKNGEQTCWDSGKVESEQTFASDTRALRWSAGRLIPGTSRPD